MESIHPLDLFVLGFYLFGILVTGIVVSKRTKTGSDLFLAGRSLGWKSIGLSLFASNISSTTLVGLAGTAYATGIAVAHYELIAAIILVFMAIYFVPVYLKSRIKTIPELLERRFDRKCRLYFSFITIFLSIFVDTAGGIYAGSLVVQNFFPSLPTWQICLSLGLVAGLYTTAGGLAAVVYTDTIQAVVLIGGSFAISYFIFQRFDFDWNLAIANLPQGHLELFKPMDDSTLPWLGALVGVPVLGFWYWVTNQYVVQRILGAKSIPDARLGSVFAGFLKLLPLFVMVIPGALAIKLYPNLSNPDLVFPTLVSNLLPAGLVGVVLAGLISAILSSVDSTLNSASALICFDFFNVGEGRDSAKIGRITTFSLMIVALLWSPMIAHLGGLFQYLQQVFCIFVPPIAAIFLLAVFAKSGNGNTAFYSMIAGQLVSLVLFVATKMGIIGMHYTISVGIVFLFSLVCFSLLAKLETKPRTTYLKDSYRPKGRINFTRDYRVYGAVVLGMFTLILVSFS